MIPEFLPILIVTWSLVAMCFIKWPLTYSLLSFPDPTDDANGWAKFNKKQWEIHNIADKKLMHVSSRERGQ